MTRVTVIRKRKFASALLPYWIITDISKQAFMQKHGFKSDLCKHNLLGQAVSRININELDIIGKRINNGETIVLSLDDSVSSIFACSFDGSVSNEIVFPRERHEPLTLILTTKGGLTTVSYPFFEPID